MNVTDLNPSLTKQALCPSTRTKGQSPSKREGKEKPQKIQADLLYWRTQILSLVGWCLHAKVLPGTRHLKARLTSASEVLLKLSCTEVGDKPAPSSHHCSRRHSSKLYIFQETLTEKNNVQLLHWVQRTHIYRYISSTSCCHVEYWEGCSKLKCHKQGFQQLHAYDSERSSTSLHIGKMVYFPQTC